MRQTSTSVGFRQGLYKAAFFGYGKQHDVLGQRAVNWLYYQVSYFSHKDLSVLLYKMTFDIVVSEQLCLDASMPCSLSIIGSWGLNQWL